MKSRLLPSGTKIASIFGLALVYLALSAVDSTASPKEGGKKSGGGIGINIYIAPPRLPALGGPRRIGTTSEAEEQRKRIWKNLDTTFYEEEPTRSTDYRPAPTPKAERTSKLSKKNIRYLDDLAFYVSPEFVKWVLTNPTAAIRKYESDLAQAKRSGNAKAERDALTGLSQAYYVMGWFSRGAESFERLSRLAASAGDAPLKARAQSGLAAVLIAWGDYLSAAQIAQEALASYGAFNDPLGRQIVLNDLAMMKKYRGAFDQASSLLEQSLQQEASSSAIRTKVLVNSARLDRDWGFRGRAADKFKNALQSATKLADPAREAEILADSAQLSLDRGDTETGLTLLRTALSRLNAKGLPADWVQKLIADAYLDMGKPDQAEPYAKKAGYDSTLGRLNILKSKPEEARANFETLLRTARNAGNMEETFTALVGLGQAYELLRKPDRAQENYTKAMQALAEIRATRLPSERRDFLYSRINGFSVVEPAQGLIRLAGQTNRGIDAITASEMVRAERFSDRLSRSFDFDAFGVPRDVLEQETSAQDKIASLKTALNVIPKQLEAQRYRDISNQIQRVSAAFNSIRAQLSNLYRKYAALRYPKPVSLGDSLIRPDEYVLMYDVLVGGVEVRLLRGKTVLKTAQIGMKDNVLEREINQFRGAFDKAGVEGFAPKKFDPKGRQSFTSC